MRDYLDCVDLPQIDRLKYRHITGKEITYAKASCGSELVSVFPYKGKREGNHRVVVSKVCIGVEQRFFRVCVCVYY